MHLISYDISHDGLRVKLARMLLQNGLQRIQYSVFMGALAPATLSKVQVKLTEIVQDPRFSYEDSVMLLPLHQYSRDHAEFLGKGPEYWDEITGTAHTLIF